MSDEQRVLEKLLETGGLDDAEPKVRGIAQLAVDEGYEGLSDLQKKVVAPHLSRICEGVESPGGHHNNCEAVLQGTELVEGLTNEGYYSGVLCERCVDETEQYTREWDRIKDE